MPIIHASKNPSISSQERNHMLRSRHIAAEGMVLLQNNGTLPLTNSCSIALYGNGARKTIKGGTGSGDVASRTVISVEQGLIHAGFSITTTALLDDYESTYTQTQKDYKEWVFKEAASANTADFLIMFAHPFRDPDFPLLTPQTCPDADAAVYVLSRNSGEGADRKTEQGDYYLTEREKKNISFLAEHYDKTIIILNVGNVIDTQFLRSQPGIDAILLMGQAGCAGGDALVDILSGKITPSGKLATTWADTYEDYPSSATFSHNNGDIDDEYYTEGIYVGYRYFDTFNVTPAYCFGYGRSYTTFSIEPQDISVHERNVTLSVRVTNTGSLYSGKEVIQIYSSAQGGNLEKPYQQLCAFAKTDTLKPSESQKLTLSFDISRMSNYREQDASWILEAATYYIRVGNSSRNTHIYAALTLERETKLEQLKSAFPLHEEFTELTSKHTVSYSYPQEDSEKLSAVHILLDLSHISCAAFTYHAKQLPLPKTSKQSIITMNDILSGNATIDELVSQLTIEEMADICVGTSRFGVNEQSIVGGACLYIPGAAGDTTHALLKSRNIHSMVFGDGPAGLRLNIHFTATKDGQVVSFDAPKDEVFSDPNLIDYYQYCTALPIATNLAQTWNIECLRDAGDIVGAEMQKFGITLWLAPGMNIHRNPLCGRNYEYYSEDPLITGLCAGYETLGVQGNPGVGVTIKHFAGNNQEDNRLYVNDHISERPLREIYLRGFELCVKLAHPMAVMTSYNLINGVHTANIRNLLTSILRDEWGFTGLVMTDWGATGHLLTPDRPPKYPDSSTEQCIASGNDLIMPGSLPDLESIVTGVQDGEITLGELQYAAKNILTVLAKTNCYADKLSPKN